MSLKVSFKGFLDFTFNTPMVLQKPRQVIIYDKGGDQLEMYAFYGTKPLKEMKGDQVDYFQWKSEEGWKQVLLRGDTRSILHFSLPNINPNELKQAIHQMRRSEKIFQGFLLATLVLTLYVAHRVFMEVTRDFFIEAASLVGLVFATYVVLDLYKQNVMEVAFGSALFWHNASWIAQTNMLRYRSTPPLSIESVLNTQTAWW